MKYIYKKTSSFVSLTANDIPSAIEISIISKLKPFLLKTRQSNFKSGTRPDRKGSEPLHQAIIAVLMVSLSFMMSPTWNHSTMSSNGYMK